MPSVGSLAERGQRRVRVLAHSVKDLVAAPWRGSQGHHHQQPRPPPPTSTSTLETMSMPQDASHALLDLIHDERTAFRRAIHAPVPVDPAALEEEEEVAADLLPGNRGNGSGSGSGASGSSTSRLAAPLGETKDDDDEVRMETDALGALAIADEVQPGPVDASIAHAPADSATATGAVGHAGTGAGADELDTDTPTAPIEEQVSDAPPPPAPRIAASPAEGHSPATVAHGDSTTDPHLRAVEPVQAESEPTHTVVDEQLPFQPSSAPEEGRHTADRDVLGETQGEHTQDATTTTSIPWHNERWPSPTSPSATQSAPIKRRAGASSASASSSAYGDGFAPSLTFTRSGAPTLGRRKVTSSLSRANAAAAANPLRLKQERQQRVRMVQGQNKQLRAMLDQYVERRRQEDASVNREVVEGFLEYGAKLLKKRDSTIAGATVLKSDEHYMEQFMKQLEEQAKKARARHEPIPRADLPRYEALKKKPQRELARLRGVLGRKPLPKILTPEQDADVEATFQKRGVIKQFIGASISDRDVAMLKPGQWLNDESINMYGQLIQQRADRAAAERERLAKEDPSGAAGNSEEARRWRQYWKVHFFSSHFLPKVVKEGHKSVARWTSRKKINIFTKDIILIPVNCGNYHWTCGAINFRRRRIEYYDSMPSGVPRDFFRTVRSYLADEHRAVFGAGCEMDWSGWRDYHSRASPQQSNGFDCGVFASATMEQLSRRDPISPYPSTPPYVPPTGGQNAHATSGGGGGGAGQKAGRADDSDGSGQDDDDEEEEEEEEELWNFSQKNMPYLRRRMVYELGRGELLDE